MKWILWIMQGGFVVFYLMSGFGKLFSSVEQVKLSFAGPLGYSVSFIYLIGALETLGALTMLASYWKKSLTAYSSLLLSLIMLGATYSNLRVGLYTAALLTIILLMLLAVLGFASRKGRLVRQRVERDRVASGNS